MTARKRSSRGAEGIPVSRLEKSVAKGQIDRIYVCLGEERLLVRRAIEVLERGILGTAADLWSKEDLHASDASTAAIMHAATQVGMLGGRRLVIVRGVDALRKKDKETLPRVFRHVPETTVLVMTAAKLDGRTSFARELKQSAVVVRCEPLADEYIPAWIRHELALHPGVSIDDRAVDRIHLLVGTDLGVLAGEIEKLVQFVGGSGSIGLDAVNRVVAGGAAASLADLVDAVGARHPERALRSLAQVLEAGTAPIQILAFLGYRMHDLWRAREGRSGGGWARQDVTRQARGYTAPELRQAAVWLFEADRRLKSSGGTPRLVLETLVRRLTATDRPA